MQKFDYLNAAASRSLRKFGNDMTFTRMNEHVGKTSDFAAVSSDKSGTVTLGDIVIFVLLTFGRDCYAYTSELISFLDQVWLTRVWTYQEILLASNPVLVCGSSHLLWSDFAFALLFLSSTHSSQLEAWVNAWEKLVCR